MLMLAEETQFHCLKFVTRLGRTLSILLLRWYSYESQLRGQHHLRLSYSLCLNLVCVSEVNYTAGQARKAQSSPLPVSLYTDIFIE